MTSPYNQLILGKDKMPPYTSVDIRNINDRQLDLSEWGILRKSETVLEMPS